MFLDQREPGQSAAGGRQSLAARFPLPKSEIVAAIVSANLWH
jgi:hypothetical protein